MTTPMQTPQQHTPSRPGTACLSCRNRKLKCSRQPEGCSNCVKAGSQCTYPQPEIGLKRKRGPYKKRKHDHKANDSHGNASAGAVHSANGTNHDDDLRPGSPANNTQDANSTTISEHLVQDALVALAEPSSPEIRVNGRHGRTNVSPDGAAIGELGTSRLPENLQPSPRHVLELWRLFTIRVAPLTRLLHCPTYLPKLLAALDGQSSVVENILACSVFYTALSGCSAAEVRLMFDRRKDDLLQEYGQFVEAAVAQQVDVPRIELLQALLLYMVCKRRDDSEAGHWTLFSSILRTAQAMALNIDPAPNHTPFEAEYRRRAWWTLCSLESRRAEEGVTNTNSLMTSHEVQLPANVNDRDLWPEAEEPCQPRDGITDMTFVLSRWKIQLLTHRLWIIRRARREDTESGLEEDVKTKQRVLYVQCEETLNKTVLQHCHKSRPWDRLILVLTDVMTTKARMSIEYPWGEPVTHPKSPEQRLDILRSSVRIIRSTHMLHAQDWATDWMWFFRGFNQWHSIAIVVAELAHSTDPHFAKSAWALLEPVLRKWDDIYKTKRYDAPWDHVNTLIQRSRAIAQQYQQSHQSSDRLEMQSSPPDVSETLQLACNNERENQGHSRVIGDDSVRFGLPLDRPPAAMPFPDSATASAYPSWQPGDILGEYLDSFELDHTNAGFLSNNADLEALNAVFADPSWAAFDPFSGFDMRDLN